jgi:hypothetical protein
MALIQWIISMLCLAVVVAMSNETLHAKFNNWANNLINRHR